MRRHIFGITLCGLSGHQRVSMILQRENVMPKPGGKKKIKCSNCEGKGLIKLGDKKVKCQRCGGSGLKPAASTSSA
jgi:hypothetical protein